MRTSKIVFTSRYRPWVMKKYFSLSESRSEARQQSVAFFSGSLLIKDIDFSGGTFYCSGLMQIFISKLNNQACVGKINFTPISLISYSFNELNIYSFYLAYLKVH
jgi:hypothetical protein